MKIQRNESCPCQSGKKYKKCCAAKNNPLHEPTEEERQQEIALAKAAHELYKKLEDLSTLDTTLEEAHALAEKYPQSHITHYLLGHCYLQKDDKEKALEQLLISVNIAPLFSGALYLLGLLYEHTQKIDQAIDCFNKVIKIEDKYSELAQLASEKLHDFYQSTECIASPEEMLNALIKAALNFYEKKEYQQALEGLTLAEAINPQEIQNNEYLAKIYAELKAHTGQEA